MVPAKLVKQVHFPVWLVLGLAVFWQSPGQVAADTKLDLLLNPQGFLAGALHAWTDNFTLGQLQNQAYGYLFPQGLFFLITDPLPDWIAQRLWWWLVLGVGFSGFYVLISRLQIGNRSFQIIAALLYALSPHTLSTISTISSETWPAMVAPWVCVPFVDKRIGARAIAAALLPAAAIGAVNATATLAALIPAFLILIYRRQWRTTCFFGFGVIAVNAWWIGPLLVLGRYAPPFTDFIESAGVTTNWLNPVEILRGTTSWAPFVDTERQAGHLLVTEPVFVMLTVLLAAAGLTGLALLQHRGLWVFILAIGLLILGTAQLSIVQSFLDSTGAAFRNVHKFDLLIRMPLLVGIAALGNRISLPQSLNPTKSQATGILVVLIALGSVTPVWSGRLLPQGTWEEIPSYWYEATEFLNEHASNTRTLILPSSPFARQTWGWTRDEPAQPLLDVPWAVRDAIPLIPPEAIRGLDGLDVSLSQESLKRLGIGAVLVRKDLAADPKLPNIEGEKYSFGEVDVYLIDTNRNMWISDSTLPKVAGGGEILSLLDTLGGYSPRELVASDAQIVTDTPQLVGTNYGDGTSSAALADITETEVLNRVPDYPSAGPLTKVVTEGTIKASSSGSDATSFGGAIPDHSINSLVDARFNTAWYPTPGDTAPWLEISGQGESLDITTTTDVTLTVIAGNSVTVRDVQAKERTTFSLTDTNVRIEFSGYSGVSEIAMGGVSRRITVPDTSPDVQQFIFQRLTVPTSFLDREFTVPRDMIITVDAQSCRDINIDDEQIGCGELDLSAGTHMLRSSSQWVSLTETGSTSLTEVESFTGYIAAADHERLLLSSQAFNAGGQATIAGIALEARMVDAAAQAFVIPAGVSGEVSFSFAGADPYRWSLFGGGIIALITIIGSVLLVRRPRENSVWADTGNAPWAIIFLVPVFGWLLLPALAGWLIPRFTLIPHWLLASLPLTIAGLWLAQAPWPAAAYPGDSPALALLTAISVVALYVPYRFGSNKTTFRG